MPWYELRVRGRLQSASGLVPGFQVVEQVVTTVLCGRVDAPAEIQPVLADVQALGLEVMEFHQVPERSAGSPAFGDDAPGAAGTPQDTQQHVVELVVLDLPTTGLPSPLTRALNGLAKNDLLEVVDVAFVERETDGTLVRRPVTGGLPKRLEWQFRRGGRWTLPVDALQRRLAHLEPEAGVLVIALETRSPVDRLEAAAKLSGGSLLTCVQVPGT